MISKGYDRVFVGLGPVSAFPFSTKTLGLRQRNKEFHESFLFCGFGDTPRLVGPQGGGPWDKGQLHRMGQRHRYKDER